MEIKKTYFRRHLPHYQPKEATYFVTFRLAGSLPREVVVRLKEERERAKCKSVGQPDWLSYTEEKKYFAKFDEYLDKVNTGAKWLSDSRIAKIVYDAIMSRDKKVYDLICFTIMPNHIHMVFYVGQSGLVRQPNWLSYKESGRRSKNYVLSPIMESLKWFTARESNKILHRTGAFWQHESYDHIVRNEKELYRIVEYVLNNPIKAGLITDRNLWKWSYVKKFA